MYVSTMRVWGSAILIAAALVFPTPAFSQYAPKSLNISGALYLPTGLPVTSTSVDFRIEIWDKNATCKLYEESHLAQNLSQTKGGFSLQLGQGTSITNSRDAGNPASLSWLVFANPGAPATVFAGCGAGVIFAQGDNRLIRVHYNLGGGMTAMTPDVPIESSAYAMVADTLEGKKASEFIQVRDDVGTDLTQSNAETVFSATNYAKLLQLLNNTFAGSYGFNNQRITDVAAPTAGTDAVNRTWVDGHVGDKAADLSGVGAGTNNGHTLVWDAGNNRWTTGVPSAVDNSKLPLAGGTMTGPATFQNINTGHITMNNQTLFMLGRYTNAQEGALGLAAGDEGRMFYNTEMDAVRVWNGAGYIGFGASGVAGGDLTGSYPNPTLNINVVTNTKIADDAVQSRNVDQAGIGMNRLVISDNVSGNALRFKTCGLNQLLRWEATGWQCVDPGTALPNTGIVAGMYGSSTTVPRIGLSATGVVTSATDVAINFPVVSVNGKTGVVVLNGADLGLGTASLEDVGNGANEVPMTDGAGKLNPSVIPTLSIGDISGAITQIVAGSGLTGGGTQGVVTLAVDLTQVDAYKLRGRDLSSVAPNDDEVLMWNALTSTWLSRPIPSAPVTTVAGRAGNVVLSEADISGAVTEIVATSPLTGGGTAGVISIGLDANLTDAGRIRGVNVSTTAPTTNQVLQYNGSGWEAATLADNGIVTMVGTNGALVSGPATVKTISIDTGVTAGQIVQVAAGDRLPVIDGRNLTQISNLRDVNVSTTAPTPNQVLQYNGSAWEAATLVDNAGVTLVAMGTGMTPGNISATGTISVDVGTGANQIVQLDGSSRLPAVNGSLLTNVNAVQIQSRDVASGLPADNQVLTWNNAAARWEARTPGAGADNLGTHVAAQNVQLNGFWLSGDGNNEGIFIPAAGNVGVGTNTPNANAILDINGLGTMSALLVPRDTAANRPAGVDGMIRYNTTSSKMEVYEGGQWADIVQPADTGITALSGDVTASGSGSVTATIRDDRITTPMIKSTGGGVNRILITDSTTGGTITFADTCAAGEVLKWNTTLGWGCDTDIDTDSGVVTLVGNNGALVSGPATVKTISIDTGVTAGQIVQVVAGDRMPVIDGRNLTQISNLRDVNVSTTTPTPNQVLQYNGSAWEAATLVDNAGVTLITAGSGLLGGTITATGTVSVDVGTGANQIVQLDGSSRLPAVNGSLLTNVNAVQIQSRDISSAAPADNQVLTWNATATRWEARAPGAGADNLGSHIAAQNVQLNGFWLSGDGNNEGIFIPAAGNVGVGTNTPNANAILDINGVGALSALLVPRDTQANRPTGIDGMIRYNTTSSKMEVYEAGQWADVVQAADGGIVTLTGTNGALVSGPATVKTISIDTGVTAGQIVQVAAGDRLPVIDGSQLTGISNLRGVNVATTAPTPNQVLKYNGSGWAPADDTTLDVAAGVGILITGPVGTKTIGVDVGIGANQIPQLNTSGFLGIGTTSVTAGVVVEFFGTGALDSAVMLPRATTASRPTGVDGMIRYNTTLAKFEVYENGNWYSMATGATGDNLGNHTATQSLELGSQWLSNDGDNEGIRIDNSGNVGIGTSPGGSNRMHVVGDSTHGLLFSNTTGGVLVGYGNGNTIQGRGADGVGNTDLNINPYAGNIIFPGSGVWNFGGNVGIGTATPNVGAILELRGTGNLSSMIVPRATTAERPVAAANGMIRYNTNTARFEAYESGSWVNMTAVGAGTGDFRADGSVPMTGTFRLNNQWLSNDGGSEGIRIDDSGNVGIGIATPPASFSVASPGSAGLEVPVRIQNNNASNGAATGLAFKVGTSMNDSLYKAAIAFERTTTNGRGKIHFLNSAEDNTNNVVLNHSLMSLNYTGSIGIGTVSPNSAAILDVNGTGNLSAMIVPRATTAERPVTAANGMIRYNTNVSRFEVYQGGSWANLATGSSTALVVEPSTGSLVGGTTNAASVTTAALYNTVYGYQALHSLTDGTENVAIGRDSMHFADTADSNVAVGSYALSYASGAQNNTAVGHQAMQSSDGTAAGNVVVGWKAGEFLDGTSNIGIGGYATRVSDGVANIGIGESALMASATGDDNIAIGVNALNLSNGASGNTVVGDHAFRAATSGANNTGLGRDVGMAVTTGSNNLFLGALSGTTVTTGSNNIAIGYDAEVPSPTGNNQLNIANIIYGQLDAGRIGIGTDSPNTAAVLDVNGTGNLSAMIVPRATTAQRPVTAANGMIRYNTNLSAFEVYQNNAWATLSTSAGGASQWTTAGSDIYYSTGNVGIGTTGPSSELEVYKSFNGDVGIKINNPSTSSGAAAGIYFDQAGGNGGWIGVNDDGNGSPSLANRMAIVGGPATNGISILAPSGDDIRFFTNGYAAINERMRVTSSGVVGIGTSSPNTATILDINGTGNLSALIVPRATTAERPVTAANGMIRYNTNLAKFEVYENGNWTNMVSSGGASQWTTVAGNEIHYSTANVGIGTNNPGYLLDVNGELNFSGTTETGTLRMGGLPMMKRMAGSMFGNSNLAIGTASDHSSLNSAAAWRNLMIGIGAGSNLTDGYANTLIGTTGVTTGIANTLVGNAASYTLTTGSGNTALGAEANVGTTGVDNIVVGASAGWSNTTGAGNTMVGTEAMNNVAGAELQRNTGVGYRVGRNLTGGGGGSGAEDNVLFGYQAGDNITTGDRNLIFGYNLDAPVATSSNQLTIGNLIFGTGANTGTGTTIAAGRVGIMSNAPQAALDVVGTGASSALIVPRDTTAARAAMGVNGMIRYNTNTSKFEAYVAGNWADVSTGSGGSSQWTTVAGNEIHYSTANVGIGTNNPSQNLHVNGGKTLIESADNVFGQLQIANPSMDEASITFIGSSTATGTSPTSAGGNSHIWGIGSNLWGIGGEYFGIGNAAAGSSLLTVKSDGNVGIGTTDPTAKFIVRNTDTRTGAGYYATSDTTVDVAPSAASSALAYYAGFNRLHTSSSNLGSADLYGMNNDVHVYNGTGAIAAAYGMMNNVSNMAGRTVSNATGNWSTITSNHASSTIGNAAGVYAAVTNTSGTITNARGIYIGPVQGTSKWSLYAEDVNAPSYFAGHVGIGVQAPWYPLHVVGTGGIGAAAFDARSNDNSVYPALYVSRMRDDATQPGAEFGASMTFALEGSVDYTMVDVGTISMFWEGAQSNATTARDSAMVLSTMQDNARAERLRIASTGNVGIGTTSTGSRLTVRDTQASIEVAEFGNDDTGTSSGVLQLKVNRATPATGNQFVSFVNNGGTDVGSITGDGAGGIQYNLTSDRRLKNQIRDTHYGIADLMKIRVRDYQYIGHGVDTNGFIAQELYEAYPHAVSKPEDESTNWWQVDYGRLTPLIVKGVQDTYGLCRMTEAQTQHLQARVDAHEIEIQNLKREVQSLREKNQELERKLDKVLRHLNLE